MVPVTIRWAREDDHAEILRLRRTCHRRGGPLDLHLFAVLAAEADGVIVGYSLFAFAPGEKGWACYGIDHGVAVSWRRQGIGRRLHEERCRVARENSAVDFIGTVKRGNAPMIRILEACGQTYRSSGAGRDFYIGAL